ncbi:mucin-2-like [Cydia amplana]|uniref:mucin-2-like n=1 Tax=Cydia amplana TaxID=1869771 RepID=UPI002FE55F9C
MSPLWIVLTLLPILGGAERFNCRGRILGAYYADAKANCKAFHVCVRVAGGGIRDFRFFCPPGTLFHQEAQTCTDWGDDDPLACPADLYFDGQFDLYKIGSGFDTKKLSSPGAREEEAEFGLQRAETGDRRLGQNNGNAPASDLRAAHSSDFFSGQRDRGRDDSAPPAPQPAASSPAPSAPQRVSFRRPTSPRTTPTTQYTNPPPPPPPKPFSNNQYDPKRKLVRKRPIHASTLAPSTFVPSSPQPQFPEYQQPATFERRVPQQSRPNPTTVPASVPPQYKDEYVEVSRVTPKQNRYFSNNPSPAPFSQTTTLNPYFRKKEGLVELYNYNAQSTPGINVQNDNKPFKVKNSFSVATDVPQEQDFVRTNVNKNNNGRGTPTTVDYNTAANRGFSTTPAYRNFNSVSYEPEKNNFVQHSNAKNFFNSPSTPATTTTLYTTTRTDPSYNLNTVAYNTNVGFNAQSSNFAESDEDDGQYRLPAGEDDGQYRPELYERERERDRELLSGAHSLNIAASGNRLPEDQQKQKGKTQKPSKPVSQTAAPRPFRPAPSPSTTIAPPSTFEPAYTTTYRPQTSTQRVFDYFQTYTTTVRPSEPPAPVHVPTTENFGNVPVRSSTTALRTPEPRPTTRAPAPPTPATRPPPRPAPQPTPQPAPKAPHFANPAKPKEDTSYDYAYYDSDPGFSEYDHIEEFGKTKTKA